MSKHGMRMLILFSTVSCCKMYLLEGSYLYCLKGGTKKNFGVLIRSGISDLHVSHSDYVHTFALYQCMISFSSPSPNELRR